MTRPLDVDVFTVAEPRAPMILIQLVVDSPTRVHTRTEA